LDLTSITNQDPHIQKLEDQTVLPVLELDGQLKGSHIESHHIKLSQAREPNVTGHVPLNPST